MKIGAMIPQGWRMDLHGISPEKQWDTILKASKDIEDLNYESVWVYDHFHTVPSPTQDPTFECWSLMAALSQVTEKVRIGQMCTCNSYRNPAYLTKVASTIDSMSGGRLEFAIGAGWYDQEYKAYGYEYPSAGIRLKMLEEALQIYIAMNTEEKATFEGEFYSIKNAINQPKPLQKPYPPLWVCGGGEKVTLKLLAKYGDYGNWDVDVDGFIHKSEILKNHCEQQERDYSSIKKTLHTNVIIGENQKDLENKIEKISTVTGIPKDMYIDKPLVGTQEKVFNTVDEFKSVDCSYIIAYIPDIVWGNSLEILSEKI
jgi:F420-dependent oxidoreductase-like protein|tara:strand:+ start:4006 stop:4947 length:942 start_codon:yes stop_codon:yes gene_type:complete